MLKWNYSKTKKKKIKISLKKKKLSKLLRAAMDRKFCSAMIPYIFWRDMANSSTSLKKILLDFYAKLLFLIQSIVTLLFFFSSILIYFFLVFSSLSNIQSIQYTGIIDRRIFTDVKVCTVILLQLPKTVYSWVDKQ